MSRNSIGTKAGVWVLQAVANIIQVHWVLTRCGAGPGRMVAVCPLRGSGECFESEPSSSRVQSTLGQSRLADQRSFSWSPRLLRPPCTSSWGGTVCPGPCQTAPAAALLPSGPSSAPGDAEIRDAVLSCGRDAADIRWYCKAHSLCPSGHISCAMTTAGCSY